MDRNKLSFEYVNTDFRYRSFWKDGKWDEGELLRDPYIKISESSTALHYGQQCFEGLKAYRTKCGDVQLFRPDQNAKRLNNSCDRIIAPHFPEDRFVSACCEVVKANEKFIPPYGQGAALYLRPYLIGMGHHLGVGPACEYLFGIFASPSGSYFKCGIKPVKFCVSKYDRAAHMGTGANKVGGNYAGGFIAHRDALAAEFADCIYLDSLTHTKIEEAGTANFFGITHDGTFVTPKSPSILPGVTKYSLMYIAENMLGMKVEERDCYIDEIDEFAEVATCGTAVVISPIGSIYYNGHLHVFHSETEVGPVTKKLYDTLTGIQFGEIEAPEDWIVKIL